MGNVKTPEVFTKAVATTLPLVPIAFTYNALAVVQTPPLLLIPPVKPLVSRYTVPDILGLARGKMAIIEEIPLSIIGLGPTLESE